jgi:hypothetical protein
MREIYVPEKETTYSIHIQTHTISQTFKVQSYDFREIYIKTKQTISQTFKVQSYDFREM